MEANFEYTVSQIIAYYQQHPSEVPTEDEILLIQQYIAQQQMEQQPQREGLMRRGKTFRPPMFKPKMLRRRRY